MHQAYVVWASIEVPEDMDTAQVGAAVTSALCGHWDHAGPCRWPHHNAFDGSTSPAQFRTLFVSEPADADTVASRVLDELAGGDWTVVTAERRDVPESDVELAERLLAVPRA